ncbi:rho GTPase-activating protein 27-like isoform X2 [Megalops cyprinoides]|uniref:rho GTPase-activating protein 27-like isoform X2 n=1 Tax=Megalops cyprinoides TaxID=118141 RepID=UPI001864845A|nr:rho GTPase-activating protein 27-like isoform X2 [Megalops cyprinoides]
MTTTSNKELVLVEFEYEYTTRDGGLVSIKPNERYLLLSKTNDHWWHVRKDENTKPFYIPAKYVKELPSDFPSPLDFVRPNGLVTPEPMAEKKPADPLAKKPEEMTIRLRSQSFSTNKAESRMSTFGVPQDLQDLNRHADPLKAQQPPSAASTVPLTFPKDVSHHIKRFSLAPGVLRGSRSAVDDMQLPPSTPRVPSFSPADPITRLKEARPAEPPVVKAETRKSVELMEPPVQFRDEADLPSENIYESIPDMQDVKSKKPLVTDTVLDGDPASVPPFVPPTIEAPPTAPKPTPRLLPPAQVERESPSTPVYVNVAELRNSFPQSPPSPSPPPRASRHLSLDLEGWEVHTDQESGQDYYYHPTTGQTTWDNPFGPPTNTEVPEEEPARSPSPSPSPLAAGTSDWEQLLDEVSGQHYFYNPATGETSWDPPEQLSSSPPHMESLGFQDDGPPPLPEEDYPIDSQEDPGTLPTFPKEYTFSHVTRTTIPRASLDTSAPAGWTRSVDPDGKWVYTSESTQEQWIKSLDDRGQAYYYTRDGSRSQWSLPEVSLTSGQPRVGNGVDQEGSSVLKNWRHTMGPSQFSTSQDDMKFHPTHRRKISDYGSDASSSGNSPELPHHADRFKHRRNPSNQSSDSQHHNTQILEKAGILNKTKIAENGKRVRKNWSQSWTVLHGGVLTFHKDPKSAAGGTSNKTNQIVPEFTLELRGAVIGWASKEKSSKKNVLELKTRSGAEFLVQYDTESIINDWHKVIVDTIRQLDLDHHSEEEEGEGSEKPQASEDKKRTATRMSVSGSSVDMDQKKVRTKLLKFLQKRPTLQSVKEKGYIRDNVFGCNLLALCAQEKTTVPSFVEKCIKAVEKRGLDIDGIYRVSGNLAVIQKLRYKADHEELDLEDGQWEDVHVITGALKLFFRELPEPLFPYSHFSSFITAINMNDYNQKVAYMRALVKSLPEPNHDTMELLFRHLRNVIEYGEENRMSVQNIAIVFGPTLLRPETESANITMHMVFQNQIVEFVLNEYEHIFYPG